MPEPVGRILQAEPLRVKDLERLHGVLGSGDLWDRVFACLFCAYARARWSDFAHGNYLRFDYNSDNSVAYAEMEVTIHKAMNSTANKFKFLDLVDRP